MEELRKKKGFICDMDGVIYHGNRLLPGVKEFVEWLYREQKNFLFLTNSSERSPKELQQKLHRMGLDVDESHFYTSALATARFISSQAPGCSAYVIGGAGLIMALHDEGITMNDVDPDYVIIGEGNTYNYENILKAVRLVLKGAKLIGTNSDLTGPAEDGIIPACRAMIAPIEMATGQNAYFVGKPNPLMMRTGLRILGVHSEEAAMIGDRMDTDMVAGIESGLDTVLVLSGITSRADIKKFPYRPRLVLDGVFNHSGDSHAWFDRHNRGTGGACHNPESPWRDWYSFSDDGTALDWLGYASLPKLDYQSESLVNEIYRGEDSIVRHWLKAPWSMDGWRLDVVHMLGEAGGARNNMQHVAGITEAAKETQPEAYIVGEHFGDARQWLQADVEDAAMNYRGFTFPLWGFLANTDISYDPQQIDAQTCMAWMDNYRAGLSHQQQLRMFNQLDSHDTARFKTLLGRDIARLPLAVVWLFTWPGVPCIYYGDEVGLDGKNDPFCRKPFPWQVEKQDTALFALYQRMIALRKKSQALRHGGCQVLYAEDNVVVFVRVLNQQRVLVAINRGEACEVVLPASPFLNAVQWQCKEGHGQLTDGILALPAISATVWMN